MQNTEEIAPGAERACRLAPNEEIIRTVYLWRSAPIQQGSYTFSMGKICIMLQGSDHPCVVNGAKVQDTGLHGNPQGRQLVVKNDKDEIVGEFRWESVAGWWKDDE